MLLGIFIFIFILRQKLAHTDRQGAATDHSLVYLDSLTRSVLLWERPGHKTHSQFMNLMWHHDLTDHRSQKHIFVNNFFSHLFAFAVETLKFREKQMRFLHKNSAYYVFGSRHRNENDYRAFASVCSTASRANVNQSASERATANIWCATQHVCVCDLWLNSKSFE